MVKQQRNAMKNRITIDVGSQGSGVGGVAIFVGGFGRGDCSCSILCGLFFQVFQVFNHFVTAPFFKS